MRSKYQIVRTKKQNFAAIIVAPDLLQNGSINTNPIINFLVEVFTQILLKLPFHSLIPEQWQLCITALTASTSPHCSSRGKKRAQTSMETSAKSRNTMPVS